ncbi:PucR family transcriptional regulator [Stagnimonas aquatica]|nr:helix-turn-helix domain-containing protein [Stagnimonas aquatica]
MSKPSRPRDGSASPMLSRQLRPTVRALSQQGENIVSRVYTAVRAEVAEYAAVRDAQVLAEIENMIRINVGIWFRALLDGRPPDAETLRPVADLARRRVHQGIPMTSLLHSFRVGCTVLWQAFLDGVQHQHSARDEVLLRLSPYMLYHTDLLGQTISHAYADEQRRGERWQSRLQHELCSIVFDRSEDREGFHERAQALGIDPLGRRIALAFALPTPGPGDAGAEDALETLTAQLGAGAEPRPIGTLRRGHALIWMAVPSGENSVHRERLLSSQLAQLPALRGRSQVAGLGLAGSGPQGWRLSAEQALRVLDIGRRLATPAPLFLYSDYVLDDTALQSRNVAGYLESLLELIAPEPHLLETLDCYFLQRRQRKTVADSLGIHPNTLAYRLQRIEALLKADLDKLSWQSRLSAALLMRRMGRGESQSLAA